jgi:c-di-GMP-binding flagellar brake protein YcgR
MDLTARNMDARKFRRVPFTRLVRFNALNQEHLSGHLAQDLSQGGVSVFSHEFVPVNTFINVQIQLKDAMKIMDVQGRVVWVRFQPLTEMYQLGLEFSDQAVFQRETIGNFIGSL